MEFYSESDLVRNTALQTQIPFFFRRIKRILAINDIELADLLEVDVNEYFHLKRNYFREISLNSWYALINKLNIHFNELKSFQLDEKALFEQYYGNKDYIPEKYGIAGSSKMRTLKSYLDFIKLNFSPAIVEEILASKQISSIAFNNLEKDISIELITDTLAEVENKDVGPNIFNEMGLRNILNFSKSKPFLTKLADVRSKKELYERFITDALMYFDKNWEYTLTELSDSGCKLKVVTKEWLADSTKDKYFGPKSMDEIRNGVLEGLSYYLDSKKPSISEITKSPHNGDKFWEYSVEF